MKDVYRCESEGAEPQDIAALDAEQAAEMYAHDEYHNGDYFKELRVVVTDRDGTRHRLVVRPEQTVDFTAYSDEG